LKSLALLRDQVGLSIVKAGLDGGNGVVHHKKLSGSVIWSIGGGWEHISVAPFEKKYTPSWEDMCWLKNTFFFDDEWAVQFHPPAAENVNNVNNCLHLWRPTAAELPTPPSWMVGIKGLRLR